jgi:hypothetical protein
VDFMSIFIRASLISFISDPSYSSFYSQGNYKKMGGSPNGSRKKVIMDPSAMSVDIGKLENRENGMDVQTYLVNSMKTLLIP